MKKRKGARSFLRKLIVVLSVLLGFVTLVSTVDAAENDSNKTYIIGTDTTYAPFEFQKEDGDFVGIDMDLLEAISKEEGFKYKVKVLGFDAAVQALQAGQVDATIAGMTITDERKKTFDFSDPYFDSKISIAVSPDSEIQSVSDLKGKQVAVKTGTAGADAAAELAKKYGFTVTTFESSSDMYEAVTSGNKAAAFEDQPVMAYAIKTGLNLRLLDDTYPEGSPGLAVQKGQNEDFLRMFNDGLKKLKASGEYDKIVDRYTSTENNGEAGPTFWTLLEGNAPALLSGIGRTLLLTLLAILFALIIGTIIGLLRISDRSWVYQIGTLYVDLFRGIPVIVLSFFIYFGIPQITGKPLSAIVAGVVTLSLNAGAYIAEIVRGGIEGTPIGQFEAGRSLGLSKGTTLRKIILPQAYKLMIPSLINQFVITLKDTSILSVIGIVELTQTGKIIIARTYQSGMMWLIIGIIYVIVITFLTKLSKVIERRTR